MKEMIFGEIVSFDQILKKLKSHEKALNEAIKSFDKWKNNENK
ncbi:Uncharacterised protein [Mycoplasmopsis citelli]|uniref:Uncharacterized protein n=1 Tax=Mycoplasmopsis citelli TaxID=171281 RepID=A0A449B107_9BACT|nr:Uncharacterised protein [Mycoplasmopsis citelli]